MKKHVRPRRLLLFLGSMIAVLCTLWGRSYYVADRVQAWYGAGKQGALELEILLDKGTIAIEAGWTSRPLPGSLGLTHHSFLPRKWKVNEKWFAVNSAGRLNVELPYWAVLTATGILLAARILHLRLRRRRTTAGACASCGYDLRASRDRCPECGTVISGTLSEERP